MNYRVIVGGALGGLACAALKKASPETSEALADGLMGGLNGFAVGLGNVWQPGAQAPTILRPVVAVVAAIGAPAQIAMIVLGVAIFAYAWTHFRTNASWAPMIAAIIGLVLCALLAYPQVAWPGSVPAGAEMMAPVGAFGPAA